MVIEGDDGGQEIQLQLRGYELRPPAIEKEKPSASDDGRIEKVTDGSTIDIATNVFETARLGHHLIFANSRADVELYTDLLRRRCEDQALPVSFFPHHGSLSREIREETESRLKDQTRPASAVCTVTLELGIDVGSVASVAQIGAPSSVAGLRQRLGRSGRRGQPAVLRVYVQEPQLTPLVPLHASLRAQLVQSIAVIRLLAAGWYKPPLVGDLHLSTLVQQLLSMIAQYGGTSPRSAWRVLCDCGPFAEVSQAMFAQFLRSLGDAGLITQMTDGTLLLAEKGERVVNHYQFYAAFAAAEEFRIVAANRTLALPADHRSIGRRKLLDLRRPSMDRGEPGPRTARHRGEASSGRSCPPLRRWWRTDPRPHPRRNAAHLCRDRHSLVSGCSGAGAPGRRPSVVRSAGLGDSRTGRLRLIDTALSLARRSCDEHSGTHAQNAGAGDDTRRRGHPGNGRLDRRRA